MAFEHQRLNHQRLLPVSMEDRLVGYVVATCGAVLVGLIALAWIALLSWSVNDPSLSHTTAAPIRNLLGAPGAVVSDLLVQTLGFAAIFALLAPSIWGLELIGASRVAEFRAKGSLFPVSVLALAGGLSALPQPPTWPLHHGLGGILGDVMYSIASHGLSMILADRAGLVTGLLYFAVGSGALAQSIGMSLADISATLLLRAKRSRQRIADDMAPALQPVWRLDWRQAFGQPAAVGTPSPRSGTIAASDAGDADQSGYADHPIPAPVYDAAMSSPAMAATGRPSAATAICDRPAPDLGAAVPARVPMWPAAAEPPSPPRPRAFEAHTEAGSRSIAERFAPHSASVETGGRGGMSGLLGALTPRRILPGYRRPSLNLLKRASPAKLAPEFTQTVLRGSARLLEDVLGDFGVKGEVRDIKPGPVVTLFELEPQRGTKASRVVALADDIARSMSATAARVAVVPGRNAIGIELPNVRRETVLLRELLESEPYKAGQMTLPLALGKSIGGEPVLADLARMPHLLVAGTTGSGKSVGINAMILSLLYRLSPDECRLLMIDPKMLELSIYNGIPHLLTPVVTDPAQAVSALQWAVGEMEERYKKMSQLGVRSIDIFNNRVRHARKRGEMLARTVQTGFDAATGKPVYEREDLAFEPLPYIVVVVDEFADLMMVAGKDIETAVQRLAQMARAAGIHLIMATQRPSVDIITGTIKANFPTRIAFRVASKVDSRTILEDNGAEQLLGQGDMLFAAGGGQPVRVHGAFVADEEVEAIAAALREQGEPNYVDGIIEPTTSKPEERPRDEIGGDDVYDRAVAIVLRDRKASTSYIQRRLGIGYNRAADLIERMEREHIIGPADHAGRREILLGGAVGPAAA